MAGAFSCVGEQAEPNLWLRLSAEETGIIVFHVLRLQSSSQPPDEEALLLLIGLSSF